MHKIKIIGRQEIIKNPNTNEIHDDAGLKALDGYIEKVYSVENDTPDIRMQLIDKFEGENPDFKGAKFTIEKI